MILSSNCWQFIHVIQNTYPISIDSICDVHKLNALCNPINFEFLISIWHEIVEKKRKWMNEQHNSIRPFTWQQT